MTLKPLRKRLEEVSKRTSLRLDIIQQDYLLSWLLIGIFQHPQLKSTLVFKGGTSLKKGYFGEYRFSEDLDFTMRGGTTPPNLLKLITEACKQAEEQMREYAPIWLNVKKYEEKQPHPEGQQAFTVNAQFPWQSEPLTKAMIEISQDEAIVFELTRKRLLHNYGEAIEQEMYVYSLE
ncbi:MAG: nucleotidyl transferase AbiEii/AbiGii toxin family protein [Ignavibacteriae bacterium]|nr:nucleotidyl transferase AbiEii/AbiGii toxin family protein [Ignavibacteriota bacterium]